jgi:hypothetical protein
MNKRPLREICGCVARVWVILSAGKRFENYTYVTDKWVKVTIEFDYNGHEKFPPPQRRADDEGAIVVGADVAKQVRAHLEEADYLAPETDARQAAVQKK